MGRHAYRFVPLAPDGTADEYARYTVVRDNALQVGSELRFALTGFSLWEVVELNPSSRPLVGMVDPGGEEIPLAGTVICRAVR